MGVINMVVGATTPDGATFAVKVDNGPVRIHVADNSGMTGATAFGPVSTDSRGVAKVTATGLDASTRYFWQVEDDGVLDTGTTGQFLTHPSLGTQASFTFAVASCAGAEPSFPGSGSELAPDAVSNHPVFDTIRTRALAEDWLGFAHLGDLHYYNLGSGGLTGSLTNYRRGYDDVLAQSRQYQLYREVPWWMAWDDHDFGPNNADGTLATKGNAALAYRERVPHYDLPAGSGENPIYQSWQIGRVLFVLSDVRYERTPNANPDNASKTMLGTAQKSWMDSLLGSSDAEFLVWLMPSQWLGTSEDGWAAFTTERDELVAMLDGHGWLRKMCMVYGDRHAVGIDSGASNDWGGFPILQAAALDSSFSDPQEGRFDILDDSPGRNQYGTVAIRDAGAYIAVTLTAWQGETELGSYTFARTATAPAPTAGALLRTVAGSHSMAVEARVLETFQIGDDPGGEEITVTGGQVVMDATADVRARLTLTTDGNGAWPRPGSDLLMPVGNEIFVRRGVDTGSEILWVPLGYFRIDSVEQDDAPDGEITITATDRMSGIVDGRFLKPRQFKASRTIGSVISALVRQIYPAAVVLYDDDTDQRTLGRQWIVEESRYQAIRDIAEAAGKVIYWDGEGVLRVETAREDDDIAWEVRESRPGPNGVRGVLVNAKRQISREGVYNAVVAYGEGADDVTAPARAIARDIGATSTTRWGGRFGKVPRFFSSSLIATPPQAREAAEAMLRRSIGFPYSVDFTAVPNPALKPWDVVRIDTGDTREKHVIDQVTIPLTADAPQTAQTREKTRIVVDSSNVIPD